MDSTVRERQREREKMIYDFLNLFQGQLKKRTKLDVLSPQKNLPVTLSSPSITQDDGGTSQEEVEDESVCLCVDVSNFH